MPLQTGNHESFNYPTRQNPYASDAQLADLRRRLTGTSTVAVFHKDGESTVIQGADLDSINVHDGILSFKSGQRRYVFTDFRYWTED